MIGKRIRKSAKIRSSIARLNDYISDKMRAGTPDHKVVCSGVFNIEGDPTRRMEETARRNKRCKDPVLHFVLSWREGEIPTKEQTHEAVKIALEELGLQEQQCYYAAHKDTENYHVQFSVSKIDPTTFKVVPAANGFVEKAIERAARRIENDQGWEVAPNSWTTFEVNPQESTRPQKIEDRIPPEVQDVEHQTGEKSAIRIAKEALKDRQFGSWAELHKALAEVGMKYEKRGSGAVITVGDTPIKASSAGKRFSLSYLEKSLGAFEEAPRIVRNTFTPKHISEPLQGTSKSDDWVRYTSERQMYYESKRQLKAKMLETFEREKKELSARQKEERDTQIKDVSWKGKRRELNILQSSIAAKQKGEKLDLKERHDEIRKRFFKMFPPFKSYSSWLKEQELEAERGRFRARATNDRSTSSLLTPGGDIDADRAQDRSDYAVDIRGFKTHASDRGLFYFDPKNSGNAFLDTGKTIRVFKEDDASLLASLQLASQKWGSVQLTGTESYKQKCLELAAEHGIKISNPELQQTYEDLKRSHKGVREKGEAKDPKEAKRAERIKSTLREYLDAVGADRYKVSAIQLREDGTKRGFMVNRRDGAPDGYTADETEAKIPRMLSLEQNDERNIYLTPISDDKHHILVDDMTNETLAQFLADGYEPAAIIESSPGNWQVIITIPKLGTEMDRAIGNELAARLNKEYGDPNVSGEIHAHRAPGFDNMKPKHKRADGTYPEVKLAKAAKVECKKTEQLAEEIRDLFLERRKISEVNLSKIEDQASISGGELGQRRAEKAYKMHFKDILKLVARSEQLTGAKTDISRIDSMAAVRLRATGHAKEDVASAIAAVSPLLREAIGDKGAHEWEDYGARTASYAFSPTGSREIERHMKYVEHWKEMEKRASAPKELQQHKQTKTKRRDRDMER